MEMAGVWVCKLVISPEERITPRTKSFRLSDGSMQSSLLEEMWPLVEK